MAAENTNPIVPSLEFVPSLQEVSAVAQSLPIAEDNQQIPQTYQDIDLHGVGVYSVEATSADDGSEDSNDEKARVSARRFCRLTHSLLIAAFSVSASLPAHFRLP